MHGELCYCPRDLVRVVDGDLSHCRAGRGEARRDSAYAGAGSAGSLSSAELEVKLQVRSSSRGVVAWLVLKLLSPAFLALEGPDWRERWAW